MFKLVVHKVLGFKRLILVAANSVSYRSVH
jgi:hypothetical protein